MVHCRNVCEHCQWSGDGGHSTPNTCNVMLDWTGNGKLCGNSFFVVSVAENSLTTIFLEGNV